MGSWIWEVGGRGRRVGKYIVVDDVVLLYFFFYLRFDGVEGEIFLVMFSFELCKGEMIL